MDIRSRLILWLIGKRPVVCNATILGRLHCTSSRAIIAHTYFTEPPPPPRRKHWWQRRKRFTAYNGAVIRLEDV